MSRWLVGSSSTRKFGGSNSISAITSRAFSPPDSTRQRFSTSSPEKPKQPASARSDPWPACGNDVLQRLEHGALAVEQVHGVLREVAQLHAAAERHAAVVRLGRAGHELEQRGLAGAVDAHHAPALAAAHHEVETLVDAAAAVALVDALQAHHVLAGARRRREIERHGLAAPRRLDPLDLLQLLHPALHLRGMRGARLEALDELDLLGEHRLLALELRPAAASRSARAAPRRIRSCPNRLVSVPPSISTTLLTMRFMNSQSCEVISSAPSYLEELLQPDQALEMGVRTAPARSGSRGRGGCSARRAASRRAASAGCGRGRRASSSRPTARRRRRPSSPG